ncbi:MAG: methyltransferase, partial [Calditrichaeota bacterium]
MDHRERFYATIERRPVDRPASWLGLPDPQAVPGLLRHFNVSSLDGIREAIEDDLYPVELPYHSPTADAIYMAFDFAGKGHIDPAHRTLNSPGVFQDVTDPARVDDFDWPDPARYISREECRDVVNRVLP